MLTSVGIARQIPTWRDPPSKLGCKTYPCLQVVHLCFRLPLSCTSFGELLMHVLQAHFPSWQWLWHAPLYPLHQPVPMPGLVSTSVEPREHVRQSIQPPALVQLALRVAQSLIFTSGYLATKPFFTPAQYVSLPSHKGIFHPEGLSQEPTRADTKRHKVTRSDTS